MGDPSDDVFRFRVLPPVAVGVPLLVGWLATLLWGDPFVLRGWSRPVGGVLLVLWVGWHVWCLRTFVRHGTGMLPGEGTSVLMEDGPFAISRHPMSVGFVVLYVGLVLVAPTAWGLLLLPVAVLLLLWGSIWPEEVFLRRRFGTAYDDYARRVRRWL